jgi:hypothetical protein
MQPEPETPVHAAKTDGPRAGVSDPPDAESNAIAGRRVLPCANVVSPRGTQVLAVGLRMRHSVDGEAAPRAGNAAEQPGVSGVTRPGAVDESSDQDSMAARCGAAQEDSSSTLSGPLNDGVNPLEPPSPPPVDPAERDKLSSHDKDAKEDDRGLVVFLPFGTVIPLAVATVPHRVAAPSDSAISNQVVDQGQPWQLALPGGLFSSRYLSTENAVQWSATLADGSPLPSWIRFDPTAHTFSGTPGNFDVGAATLRVIVTASDGTNAFKDFQLTVHNVNDPPVLSHAITNQTLQSGAFWSLRVPAGTFDDPDLVYGDRLVTSVHAVGSNTLPSWLHFDATSQTLSGTPGRQDLGHYALEVTATDLAGASVSDVFSVDVVHVNTPPAGSVTVVGNAAQGQTLTAATTLSDVDGLGPLSYRWQSSADGTTWTDVAAGSGASVLLGQADVGKVVRVVVSYVDGYGTAEAVASGPSTAVLNVNDPPVGTVTVSGAAVQGQVLTASNDLTDADGLGTVSYHWQSSADGTTWIDMPSGSGTTVLLGQADVGKVVRVVASYVDGYGTAEAVASGPSTAVLNVNDPPVGTVTVSGIAVQGQVLSASNDLTDADGLGTVSYRWQSSADGTTWIDMPSGSGTTVLLDQADVGKVVRVVASYVDGYGTAEAVASGPSTAVLNVNDPPVGTVTVSGAALQGQVLTASNDLTDADGLGTVSYRWQSSADGTTWTDMVSGSSATVQLGQGDVGKTIRVVASYVDGYGTAEAVASGPTTAVLNVNDPPVGSVAIAGTPIQGQTLTASNDLTDADGMGTVSYRWQESSGGATWTDMVSGSGTTVLLGQADVGKTVRVVASFVDGYGSAEAVASGPTTAVLNVNDPPVGSVVIAGTPMQGQTLTASNDLTDADGMGTVSYRWQESSGGATWTDMASGSGTTVLLGQADVGKTVRVVASYVDGYGSAEAVASGPTTAVLNVNDPPVGSVVIAGTPVQGQTLTASNDLTDADGMGTVSYRWQESSDGARWVDVGAAGAGQYALSRADVGSQLRVVASYVDGQGTAESVTSMPTAVVSWLNSSPTLVYPVAAQVTQEGATWLLKLPGDTFSDADIPFGDHLSYAAALDGSGGLPAWLSFDPASGQFSGTPAGSDVGVYHIRVTATDSAGAQASDVFTLEVDAVNHAPVVASALGTQGMYVADGWQFTIPSGVFADPDPSETAALRLSAAAPSGPLPSWLSFDSATGTFAVAPGAGPLGILDLTVTATDPAGASVSSSFELKTARGPNYYMQIAGVGDINHDGYADVLAFAPFSATNDGATKLQYYAFFGGPSLHADVDLADLNFGSAVAWTLSDIVGQGITSPIVGAGDLNGDGVPDLLIGRPYLDGPGYGSAFAVYSPSVGFAAIDLEDIRTTPSAGFVLDGKEFDNPDPSTFPTADMGNVIGFAIGGHGDFNGDGWTDVIAGAPFNSNGDFVGLAAVYFGSASLPSVTLRDIETDASRGLVLFGTPLPVSDPTSDPASGPTGNEAGFSVASAGDFNGDGIDDWIVGQPGPDANSDHHSGAFVVFGSAVGGSLNVDDLQSSGRGITILPESESNDWLGYTVAGGGDVNGDGLGDVVVTARNAQGGVGRIYVVDGTRDTNPISLSDIASGAAGGFVIIPDLQSFSNEWSASLVGDVNGDGLADVLVSEPYHGAILVWGKATPGPVNLDDLLAGDHSLGVVVSGPSSDWLANAMAVSAGDMNGDGVQDFVISDSIYGGSLCFVSGASLLDAAGPSASRQLGTSGDDTLSGTSASDALIGGAGNDVIDGQGGADVIDAGAGDDRIVLNSDNVARLGEAFGTGSSLARASRVDGGAGIDTLVLAGGADLDLTSHLVASRISSIERIDLAADTAANALVLDPHSLMALSEMNVFNARTTDLQGLDTLVQKYQLMVLGGAEDQVTLANASTGTWVDAGQVTSASDGSVYHVYDYSTLPVEVLIKEPIPHP